MVLTVGYITEISSRPLRTCSTWDISVVIINILLPASPSSHRTSSPFQHSCLLAVDILMTNFMSSSTSPSHLSCTIPPILAFLVLVFHLGRCWGLPHPSPRCRYLPWESWTHGCQGAVFHCCPGGHTLRCSSVLCPTMKHGDFLFCHSGSYLITWTPKLWSAGFCMTQSWFSSFGTYLLSTCYMLDTVVGIGAIMVSKSRHNSSCPV